jgi:transposase
MVKKRRKRDGMAELQPRKIRSKVARSLLSGRHYEGAVHTMNVFLRAGKEVVRMGEEFSTMNCKECGILNEKHSNESWTCKNPACGAFHLRDPAASLCIFKKALARN